MRNAASSYLTASGFLVVALLSVPAFVSKTPVIQTQSTIFA
jgi:hypothetical protein